MLDLLFWSDHLRPFPTNRVCTSIFEIPLIIIFFTVGKRLIAFRASLMRLSNVLTGDRVDVIDADGGGRQQFWVVRLTLVVANGRGFYSKFSRELETQFMVEFLLWLFDFLIEDSDVLDDNPNIGELLFDVLKLFSVVLIFPQLSLDFCFRGGLLLLSSYMLASTLSLILFPFSMVSMIL